MNTLHLVMGPAEAGLPQLAVQLLRDYAGDGVGVTCTSAGAIQTPEALLEDVMLVASRAGRLLEEGVERRFFLVRTTEPLGPWQCQPAADVPEFSLEDTQVPVVVWYLLQDETVEALESRRESPAARVKRQVSQWLTQLNLTEVNVVLGSGAEPATQEVMERELAIHAIRYRISHFKPTASSGANPPESMLGKDSLLFARERGLLPRFNIAEHLLTLARDADPNAWALRHETGDLRYGELEGCVQACVSKLIDLDVGPGCRVTLVSSDSVHMSIVLVALLYTGATVVVVNPLMQGAHIVRALECARSTLTIADEGSIRSIKRAGANSGTAKLKLIEDVADVNGWRQQGQQKKRWKAAPTSPFDFAFGMFTSGTTGTPKLALHRHQDFLVAAERYASQVLNIGPSDRVFSASRLSFAFGLHNMFNALLHKATAILAPRATNAQSVVDYIEKYTPTAMFAVPTIYQFVLALDVVDKSCFESINVYVSAGERLPQALGEKWESFSGRSILDSLGSTEVFSTYLSNLPGFAKPEATGKLVPGFDAKLVGADGNICDVDEAGTLWVKGPTIIGHYHSNTPANDTQFADGWFCTNDVFKRDSENYFYYCGRSDDMFKVAGQWISPQEIENVLLRHPQVVEVAVVPVGDCEKTTRPKAYVVLKSEGESLPPTVLKEWSKTQLEHWKYPHFIEYVDQLPRTATGKLQRYMLRERHTAVGAEQ